MKEKLRNIKSFFGTVKEKLFYRRDFKFLCIAVICVIIGIFIFCNRNELYYYYQSVGREQYPQNTILVPNVTGYDEEDAMEKLRETGFENIERSYIFDKFTRDGAVVKLNYDINAPLNAEDRIVVYICKTDTTPVSEIDVNKDYYSMDYINIVDMVIKDNQFYAIIKNKNKAAIKDISYKIGYQDADKKFIGEKQYKLNDITILPDEKIFITGEIEKKDAAYITFSGFNYSTLEVPEKERISN